MKKIAFALLVAGLASSAEAPALVRWTAASMKEWHNTLAPKLNAQQSASERLADFGNYTFSAMLRKATGASELHETQADIFVVESGECTLITGGTMVAPKTTEPHEVRGTGIKGGKESRLGTGDVVTIPAKMPHWVKLDPGKEIVYMLIKVTQ